MVIPIKNQIWNVWITNFAKTQLKNGKQSPFPKYVRECFTVIS